jgi:hypothetical protein
MHDTKLKVIDRNHVEVTAHGKKEIVCTDTNITETSNETLLELIQAAVERLSRANPIHAKIAEIETIINSD